jgi:hypothetical protein
MTHLVVIARLQFDMHFVMDLQFDRTARDFDWQSNEQQS